MEESPKDYYTSEQVTLIEVLRNYKNFAYLWNPSHKFYKNKNMRDQAWQALLEKWKAYDSDATVDTIKRKIENLRATFNKEWKKVESSKTSEDTNKYVPSLWYYKYLTFLNEDQKQSTAHQPSKRTRVDSTKCDDVSEKEKKVKVNKHSLNDLRQKQEQLIDIALNVLSAEEDSCDSFACAMGDQLKEMSKLQRCIAEKLISEVMFYGKLGQLTMKSSIDLKSNSCNSYTVPSLTSYDRPITYSP